MSKPFFKAALTAAALLALGALPAQATLGGQPLAAPSPGTAAIKKQSRSTAASALYTVHETTLDNGTVLREFANSKSGQVFALTWRGPVLPDMQDVLGSYLPLYQQQLQQRRAQGWRRGPVAIRHDSLVLRSNGRMRNFSGQAYAPALLPSGVAIAELQP